MTAPKPGAEGYPRAARRLRSKHRIAVLALVALAIMLFATMLVRVSDTAHHRHGGSPHSPQNAPGGAASAIAGVA